MADFIVKDVNGSIRQSDWDLIYYFIKEYGIKNVIEFGAGQSTELFEKMSLDVISYETQKRYIENSKAKTVKFVLWDLSMPVFPRGYNFVFIDGPFGGQNREPSYKAAVQDGIEYVAAHDTGRSADKIWIDKYLKDWKVITSNNRTTIWAKNG